MSGISFRASPHPLLGAAAAPKWTQQKSTAIIDVGVLFELWYRFPYLLGKSLSVPSMPLMPLNFGHFADFPFQLQRGRLNPHLFYVVNPEHPPTFWLSFGRRWVFCHLVWERHIRIWTLMICFHKNCFCPCCRLFPLLTCKAGSLLKFWLPIDFGRILEAFRFEVQSPNYHLVFLGCLEFSIVVIFDLFFTSQGKEKDHQFWLLLSRRRVSSCSALFCGS